jgi:H+/Cl- antiporter ClcA
MTSASTAVAAFGLTRVKEKGIMSQERIEPRPYLRLLLLAALLGLVSAVITFVFMVVVNVGQTLIWEQAVLAVGVSAPVFTLVICALGGLLVGVLVKVFGDHSGIFAEMMLEFGKTGRFNYRHAPGIVITALVSLIAGGSLGPEAPLADACGSLGTLTAEKLKLDERGTRSLGFSGLSGMLAAFLTSPFGGALLGLESARGGNRLRVDALPQSGLVGVWYGRFCAAQRLIFW